MLGIPLLENVYWFRGFFVCGFLVSWILGLLVFRFLVSKIIGFLVPWFQRFLAFLFQCFKDLHKIHFMFDRYLSHIQDFRDFIKRVSQFVGARLFKQCQNMDVLNVGICKNNTS